MMRKEIKELFNAKIEERMTELLAIYMFHLFKGVLGQDRQYAKPFVSVGNQVFIYDVLEHALLDLIYQYRLVRRLPWTRTEMKSTKDKRTNPAENLFLVQKPGITTHNSVVV